VNKKKKSTFIALRREWKASLRDTFILFGEFKIALGAFLVAILGIAFVYYSLSIAYGTPVGSYAESVYLILTLTFLQPSGEFPTQPLLQMWFFIMPLIGIATLAFGLTDFGVALFNRRARSKEWEMAVASTFSNHTVLVGLGHLGYRVIQKLHEIGEEVVAIELSPDLDIILMTQKMGIPVIQNDASHASVLESAGIKRAKDIVLCSQNDSLNLQIALKARSLNPDIQVVIRIFDEDFAEALQKQFGFTALSATGMAAPVFAAAAAGADVTSPISVEGQQLSLARLTISPTSQFAGKTVGYVEDNYHLNIVLVRYDHQSDMHPTDNKLLGVGNVLAVLGGPSQLSHLMHDNEG
jgi:voltage-gated potassium channel